MNKTKAMTGANPLATEKISHLIIRYSLPAIISGLVSAIYNMVDQIFLGWGVGDLGMAATNVAFPFTTICMAMALLFGIGGASRMSLSLGKGDKECSKNTAGNTLLLLLISGSLIALVSLVFLEPLLTLFGATAPIMPYAKPYTLITAIGMPFLVFSMGASHLIRADGDPTFAMITVLSGAIFNIIADPLFLFGLGMGIEGIALATTLGQMLSSGLALYYLLRKARIISLKKHYFRLKASLIKAIAFIGAAACFNQLAMTVVQIVLNNLMTYYGGLSSYGSELPLAVVGAVSKIGMLFMVVIIGVAQGSQPIIGFNYGAGNYGRVIETYKKALTGVILYAIPVFLSFQLFPTQILSIFGSGNEAFYEFGSRYMRIYMMMLILIPVQGLTSNFFTAIGKSFRGLLMSLSRQILFLLPLLFLFTRQWGLDGILYSAPIADIASFIVTLVFISRELKVIYRMSNQSLSQVAYSAAMNE